MRPEEHNDLYARRDFIVSQLFTKVLAPCKLAPSSRRCAREISDRSRAEKCQSTNTLHAKRLLRFYLLPWTSLIVRRRLFAIREHRSAFYRFGFTPTGFCRRKKTMDWFFCPFKTGILFSHGARVKILLAWKLIRWLFFFNTFVFVIINEWHVFSYHVFVIRCQLCEVFRIMWDDCLMCCHALDYSRYIKFRD